MPVAAALPRVTVRRPDAHAPQVDDQVKQLLHELQVHQVELEMQNDELRRTQDELAAALRRYTELYDHAPVGYLTLDSRSRITQLNRAAATLLGTPADEPGQVPFTRFLPRASLAQWRLQRAAAALATGTTSFELEIRPGGTDRLLQVHVDLSADRIAHSLRVVLADVSEVRSLERAAQDAALMEHERMSADIHDGLSQELAGLSLSLRSIQTRAEAGEPASAADFAQLNDITTLAIASCRSIVRGLSPVGENEGGLLTALRNLVERGRAGGGAAVDFEVTGRARVRVPLVTADHLFRIAQEGLTNARKHSAASRISVSIDIHRTAITLQVVDDGIGYGGRPRGDEGSGLRLMRFRAAAIHAQLSCEAPPEGGTRLRCVCPQPEEPG